MKLNSLIIFALISILYLLEYYVPYRQKFSLKNNITNLSLGLINKIFLSIFIPVSLYQTYFMNINNSIRIETYSYSLLITIFLFDLAIYWQHRFFHLNNFLFKFHMPHHTDELLNVSSGVRFHPLEIILSGIFKLILLITLNPKIEYYLIYESCLLGFSLFNHSNIQINHQLEKALAKVFVTPLVHRSHHDQNSLSMNRNFGNILVFWDKIFNTFELKPEVKYGVNSQNDTENLLKQLQIPFKK